MKEFRLGPIVFRIKTVSYANLELSEAMRQSIEENKKPGENFEQAAKRLIVSGLLTETSRLQGADIVQRDSSGQKSILYKGNENGSNNI